MVRCKAMTIRCKRQCVNDARIDGLCIMHYKMTMDGRKIETINGK